MDLRFGEAGIGKHPALVEDEPEVRTRHLLVQSLDQSINVTNPAGRDAVLALASSCDVYVENFRGGKAAQLGLDETAVRAHAPTIVYASMSAFGSTGPDVPGFNPLYFGHFAHLPRDRFTAELAHIMADDARIYESIARDLWGQGVVLAQRKYRYLRWAYTVFLAGTFVTICASLWTWVLVWPENQLRP